MRPEECYSQETPIAEEVVYPVHTLRQAGHRTPANLHPHIQTVKVGDIQAQGLRDIGSSITLVSPVIVSPEDPLPDSQLSISLAEGQRSDVTLACVQLDLWTDQGEVEVEIVNSLPTPVIVETDQSKADVELMDTVPTPVISGKDQGEVDVRLVNSLPTPVIVETNQSKADVELMDTVPTPVTLGSDQEEVHMEFMDSLPTPVVSGSSQEEVEVGFIDGPTKPVVSDTTQREVKVGLVDYLLTPVILENDLGQGLSSQFEAAITHLQAKQDPDVDLSNIFSRDGLHSRSPSSTSEPRTLEIHPMGEAILSNQSMRTQCILREGYGYKRDYFKPPGLMKVDGC
ncbi:uncharacterized protein ACNLHF_016609 [Anomaloglossus baeobatrachus]|uniref:uncharacterized protein LOC142302273 n=1 Tax=Anomaloglossus baeobatrachus TaxID=238106 RepID=UPI003F4F78DB